MWATSARTGPAADVRCLRGGGGATGAASAGVGGEDEQGAGNAPWRCGRRVTGRIWLARAPQYDLPGGRPRSAPRSEEHTSELQSRVDLVCRLLLEKKK